MAVKIKDIADMMEKLAPLETAEEWDNCGLIVGRGQRDVNRVLVALDITPDVVREAVRLEADLVVTHHPPIFKPLLKMNDQSYIGDNLLSLIENKIGVYSAHTNLDAADRGTNGLLAELLGLTDVEGILHENSGCPMGRVGRLALPLYIEDLAGLVKTKLGLSRISYTGPAKTIVEKVGICTGSGSKPDFLKQAVKANCHAYITGDVSYHNAQYALYNGLCLIDATHYGSERIVVDRIRDYISTETAALGSVVEVFSSKTDGSMFQDL